MVGVFAKRRFISQPRRSSFPTASGYEYFVLYYSLPVPRPFGMGGLSSRDFPISSLSSPTWQKLNRWIRSSHRRSRFLPYPRSAQTWVRASMWSPHCSLDPKSLSAMACGSLDRSLGGAFAGVVVCPRNSSLPLSRTRSRSLRQIRPGPGGTEER